MKPIIECRDVSFSYTGVIPAVEMVNLTVFKGEFLGVIGPNAGGKSTLLKLMLGLLEPDQGTIRVIDKPPLAARSRMGYVPQYPAFLRDFPISVLDMVLQGRLGETRWYGGYSQADKHVAHEVLRAVESDDLAQCDIGSLSSGQLQRVLIARALASSPDILILDEPTTNIDMRVEEHIFSLLKKYNTHMTIIIVSHDVGFISGYVNRVACLNRTLRCHTTEEIDGKTIEDLYGVEVKMIRHAH